MKNNPPYNIFDDDMSKEERHVLMKEEAQFGADEFNKMLIKKLEEFRHYMNLE